MRVAQESGREIYPVRLPALAEELAAGWSGDFTDPMDADILTELTVSRPNVPSQPAQGHR